jgi:hypothetical protein
MFFNSLMSFKTSVFNFGDSLQNTGKDNKRSYFDDITPSLYKRKFQTKFTNQN